MTDDTTTPDGWIEVEGDKPKVERTRHYFAATLAALKTAYSYIGEVEREMDDLPRRLAEAETRKERLEQVTRAARGLVDHMSRSEPVRFKVTDGSCPGCDAWNALLDALAGAAGEEASE